MATPIDLRLNAVFKSYEEFRVAEIKNDVSQMTKHSGDGLTVSCLMLREIQEIEPLRKLAVNTTVLKVLADPRQRDTFLKIERKFLEFTKLDPHVIDYLIDALEHVIQDAKHPDTNWRDDLELVTHRVCHEAKLLADRVQPRSLLKRALVAGGGALIALVNLIPLPGLHLTPEATAASTTAGTWMITQAAQDHLKKFFES